MAKRLLHRGSALTKAEQAEFGPMQIMVVGLDTQQLQGHIIEELERLRSLDIVRLVDLVVVSADDDGNLLTVQLSDLTDAQAADLGAIAGALIGLGAAGEDGIELGAELGAAAISSSGGFVSDDAVWAVADVIPKGTTAAVVILEHRWAIRLRDAVRDAGGSALADAWIHPEDLIAYGLSSRRA